MNRSVYTPKIYTWGSIPTPSAFRTNPNALLTLLPLGPKANKEEKQRKHI